MGNMTKAEAVEVINSFVRYFSKQGHEEDSCELDEAADVLGAFRMPDPNTGLMPCGCGHKLILLGNDEIGYWVECDDISNCMLQVGAICDGSAGLFYTKEAAIKAANKAMGVKEADDENQ